MTQVVEQLRLNTLQPTEGARKKAKRVGRGVGSGVGKTSRRGHKGQHARSGGYHRVGFEGGQMPIQRRLPKYGFTSHRARVTAEIRLSDLEKMTAKDITFNALKSEGLVGARIKFAKIIGTGEIKRAVNVTGLRVTRGAKAAIEAVGGTVELPTKPEAESGE